MNDTAETETDSQVRLSVHDTFGFQDNINHMYCCVTLNKCPSSENEMLFKTEKKIKTLSFIKM